MREKIIHGHIDTKMNVFINMSIDEAQKITLYVSKLRFRVVKRSSQKNKTN